MTSQDQQPYQPQGNQNNSQQQTGEQPQVVYMTRPVEPQQQELSDEARKRCEESKRKYPRLNLSEGEYVIFAIKRHPIGLVYIWTGVIITILAVFAILALFASSSSMATAESALTGGINLSPEILLIPALLITVLALIFGFVAAYIYTANEFYLTNESVIQHIQTSLFNRREQTISLANVEDASYSQDGILPHLFGYGLIRLSTQGDETTYRFNYASHPSKQIAVLNNAVESFKNIRPISHQLQHENN